MRNATAALPLLLVSVTSLSAGCAFPDPDLGKPITRLPPRTRFPSPPPPPGPKPLPDMPPPGPAPPLPPPAVGAPPRYRFVALPEGFTAAAVGAGGEVVGWAEMPGRAPDGHSRKRAAVWRAGRVTLLDAVLPPPGDGHGPEPWPEQFAVDVNASGLIVGGVRVGFTAPSIACYYYIGGWRGSRATLRVPFTRDESGLSPEAVNGRGWIVGSLRGSGNSEATGAEPTAVLWTGGKLRMLDWIACATDVNDRGQIVGWHMPETAAQGGERAAAWTPHGRIDLGPGVAAAINDRGETVGTSGSEYVEYNAGAFAFLHDGRERKELTAPGFYHAGARDINNRSQVVGYGRRAGAEMEGRRAVLWQGRRGYELGPRVMGKRGWVLREALSINERGQILCEAECRGRPRFCLLTPSGRRRGR